jgi:inorganic pyrophosphatase
MSEAVFTPDNFVEVRVVEPGDDCNLYGYDAGVEGLRLFGVHRTTLPAPVDHAIVPDTSLNGASDLGVLLVSHRPTLPGCAVKARPIALLEMRRDAEQEYRVIAVPADDETMHTVATIEDLPTDRCQAIVAFIQAGLNGHEDCTLLWGDAAQASQVVHQLRQMTRLARAKARKGGPDLPIWKPLGVRVSGARRASDTEPHTEAEYAYHQLPRRFQRYVDEYLAPNERILFAVNRPAMKSALKRTWLSSPMLQEGILLITDQQVALVTEVLPPGRASIKYGYLVHTGIPERIEAVAVRSVAGRACFEVSWRAAGGNQCVSWEFPAEASEELKQAVKILDGWQPRAGDRRLRRAYGPPPVEMELHDPAANNPADIVPLACRLAETLADQLSDGERVLACTLLPAWADDHKVAHIFAVTDRRAFLLPDPANHFHLKPDAYPLERITTAEFTSSILESWLALHILNQGEVLRAALRFPYTADGFQVCFTTLRQQLVAVPPGCLAITPE